MLFSLFSSNFYYFFKVYRKKFKHTNRREKKYANSNSHSNMLNVFCNYYFLLYLRDQYMLISNVNKILNYFGN